MKAYIHAQNSVNKYGGVIDDYIKIHNFIDQSKSGLSDERHRALLHNSLGPFIAEQAFGITVLNSEKKRIPVRSIVEDHILEDLGVIPTLQDWLEKLPLEDWMFGGIRKEGMKEVIVDKKKKQKMLKNQSISVFITNKLEKGSK